MSHSEVTPKYGLPVFRNTDKPAWMDEWNSTMFTLDGSLSGGGGGGGGVAKEYVDAQDAKTLKAAEAYTDTPSHTTLNVEITTEGAGGYVSDHTSKEIIDHRNSGGVVIARFTDPATSEVRDYLFAKRMPDGRAAFSKDGYIEDGVSKQTIIYVDFEGKVTTETRQTVVDAALSETSENPVQNKVISQQLAQKANKTKTVYLFKGRVPETGNLVFTEFDGKPFEAIQFRINFSFSGNQVPGEVSVLFGGESQGTVHTVTRQEIKSNEQNCAVTVTSHYPSPESWEAKYTDAAVYSTIPAYMRTSPNMCGVNGAGLPSIARRLEIRYPNGIPETTYIKIQAVLLQ